MSMSPMMTHRLAPQPAEVLDRSRPLIFKWRGRAYPAFEGDTIVSALAACGSACSRAASSTTAPAVAHGQLSRPGLHRAGRRRAERPRRPPARRRRGWTSAAQNAWPSLGFDVGRQPARRPLHRLPASTTRPSSSRSDSGRPTRRCSSASRRWAGSAGRPARLLRQAVRPSRRARRRRRPGRDGGGDRGGAMPAPR